LVVYYLLSILFGEDGKEYTILKTMFNFIFIFLLISLLITVPIFNIIKSVSKNKIKKIRNKKLNPFNFNSDLEYIKYKIAVHEIGHTISLWNRSDIDNISVLLNYKNNDGLLFNNFPAGGINIYNTRKYCDPWQDLISNLSGITAEYLYFSYVDSGGSAGDLTKALENAKLLATRQFNYKHKITNRVDFQKFFKIKLSSKEHYILQCAYNHSVKILKKYLKEHTQLTQLLVNKNQLTEKDIEPILGSRNFQKSLFKIL